MASLTQDQMLNNLIINTVKYVASIKHNKSSDYLFKTVWEIIYQQMILYGVDDKQESTQFKQLTYGPYQLNIRECLLLKIICLFRAHEVDYCPELHVRGGALEELESNQQSAVFVSTHNGFAHAVRILTDIRSEVTTIGYGPRVQQSLNMSGVKLKVNVINNDRYSLAYLQEHIARGNLVSTTVDFQINKGLFENISPAIFKFAKINSLPLFFLKSEVLENGKVEMHIRRSSQLNSSSPAAAANDFITFHNSVSPSQKSLYVRSLKV
jgi:hypothetical protein